MMLRVRIKLLQKLTKLSFSCPEKAYDFLKPSASCGVMKKGVQSLFLWVTIKICFPNAAVQHVSAIPQTESATVFATEQLADRAVARFGEVFLFIAFLALGCKGTFIGVLRDLL